MRVFSSPLSRRVAFGLLSTAALAVSILVLPASAAQAGPEPINVQMGNTSAPSNIGLVSVYIQSFSPLTSMTLSLYQNGTDMLDLPISDFNVPADDGDGQFGTWTLKSPITTNQLPLGIYNAEVSATDSNGDSVTGANAGPYYFKNVVSFPTFTSNGTTFNYAQQDVTFSGTATLLAPGGTPVPLANQTLELTSTYGAEDQPVTTDASGDFTVTVTAQSEWFQMVYAGNTQTLNAASNPINISVTQSPVTIAAALAVADVNEGDPDSMRGTATYIDDGTPAPLAGATISVYRGSNPVGAPWATGVTDVSGSFTLPVATNASGSWTVAIDTTEFLKGSQGTLQLTVRQPNKITGFRANLSRFATVTYSGCITAASGGVAIQYATSPTGPWHPLGMTSHRGPSCTLAGGSGVQFLGQVRARLAGAYYRTVYAATPTWQGAVSGAVFLHKYLTKITSFAITPTRVARNGSITVSGRLWKQLKSGRWQAYADRHIIVVFRYQGVWYRYRHVLTTDNAGRFRGTFKVLTSSPFFAQYNGDSTHFASASNRIAVTAGANRATSALSRPTVPALIRTFESNGVIGALR